MEQGHHFDAISPLDGRYRTQVAALNPMVSEAGLIRYRAEVELRWLLHLAQALRPDPVAAGLGDDATKVEGLLAEISVSAGAGSPAATEAVKQIKKLEQSANHDVKAVEYYLRQRLAGMGASPLTQSMVHFAATSEDINNTSYGLMMKAVRGRVLLPAIDQFLAELINLIRSEASTAMLSRTHGQPASPTTLGRELAVFASRIERQRQIWASQPILAKFNGAVGAFNAHAAVFPTLDWIQISTDFVEAGLGLTCNPLTTQIENHDGFAAYADDVRRLNTILIDFCRDVWGYIALGYFRLKPKDGEVGSSTMPHKVNPIDFENGEGNAGLANAFLTHFAEKLPVSRWQRDLSDSTVMRAFGSAMGHTLLSWTAAHRGLTKLSADHATLAADLQEAWEVLAEPIQMMMRRFGVTDAYERLKAETRGQRVSRDVLLNLITGCPELPDDAKSRLAELTPSQYVGLATRQVEDYLNRRSNRGDHHSVES